MIDEVIKSEFLYFIEKELDYHKDSPYDEIPLALIRVRDEFLELCKR